MSAAPQDKPKRLLSASSVRSRYDDICTRTVDRWVKAGVLPEPIRIRGQRFWDVRDLEALERASVGSRPNTSDTETIEPQARPDG